MTELEALKARHSIRKYIDRPLDPDIKDALRKEIILLNAEGDLHMQLVVDERRAFSGLLSYGVFSNVSNYIMVVGRKSKSLEYRAGYYAERLVLFAQEIGLNTCIVGLSYRKVEDAFDIRPDEKVVICIAIGYGADEGKRHKIKAPEQVSNISKDTPEWFAEGVDAALLAPTAINQQKFHFEYIAPSNKNGGKAGVRPTTQHSLVGYTKIDLGIAMCNFEIGAGEDNFVWIDSPLR